jgi:translation initiation factor IF-1
MERMSTLLGDKVAVESLPCGLFRASIVVRINELNRSEF